MTDHTDPLVALNVRIPESLLKRLDEEADRCLISRRVVIEQAVRGLLEMLEEADAAAALTQEEPAAALEGEP